MKHKLLIVHYIIGAYDGVNRVIEANVKGLKAILDVEITLAGKVLSKVDDADHHVNINELNLDYNVKNVRQTAAVIEKKLKAAAGGKDIVIIENPSIGMHPAATFAFYNFVKNNPDKKIFYRIHAHAEDRPLYMKEMMKFKNFYEILYPNFPNLKYITVNTHDSEILEKREIPNSHVYYVPNGLDEKKIVQKGSAAELKKKLGLSNKKIILYPARTIDRKNIEEAILLTLILNKLLKQEYVLCISQGPKLKCDEKYMKPIFEIIKKQKLPVKICDKILRKERVYSNGKIKYFAVTDMYKISDLVLTTSSMEGFGYAFIEPWLFKKFLVGRALNFISRDLEKAGLKLEHLYTQLVANGGTDFKNIPQKEKLKIIENFEEEFKNIYGTNRTSLDKMVEAIKDEDRFKLIEYNRSCVKSNFSIETVTTKLADSLGISVRQVVKQWFDTHTFDSHEYDPKELVKLKKGQTISVCIPTLNEEKTIHKTVLVAKELEKIGLVDEVVVIDSGSTDRTKSLAEKAGAKFYRSDEHLKEDTILYGKGQNLWMSLYLAEGDIIVWIDADIHNIDAHFIYGLIGPILNNDEVGFVKGFYRRPLKFGQKLISTGGGRVTEILSRPMFSMFYPELTGFVQPLSGEYAGRREILEKLPFFVGYGVETGLLIDILENFGLHCMAQVDLKKRIHRNHQTHTLGKMSFGISQVLLKRLKQQDKIKLASEFKTHYVFPILNENVYSLAEKKILELEKEPIINIQEYREKFYPNRKFDED